MYTLVYGISTDQGECEEKQFATIREATAWRKKTLFSGVNWWLYNKKNDFLRMGVNS
jgi:hypothetical protein